LLYRRYHGGTTEVLRRYQRVWPEAAALKTVENQEAVWKVE
jgi:hypothetical protein